MLAESPPSILNVLLTSQAQTPPCQATSAQPDMEELDGELEAKLGAALEVNQGLEAKLSDLQGQVTKLRRLRFPIFPALLPGVTHAIGPKRILLSCMLP